MRRREKRDAPNVGWKHQWETFLYEKSQLQVHTPPVLSLLPSKNLSKFWIQDTRHIHDGFDRRKVRLCTRACPAYMTMRNFAFQASRTKQHTTYWKSGVFAASIPSSRSCVKRDPGDDRRRKTPFCCKRPIVRHVLCASQKEKSTTIIIRGDLYFTIIGCCSLPNSMVKSILWGESARANGRRTDVPRL